MGITGDAEAGRKVGVAVIDVATGLHAGAAVLAALFRREREGVGSRLTLSLWTALDLVIIRPRTPWWVAPTPAGWAPLIRTSCPTAPSKRPMVRSPSRSVPTPNGQMVAALELTLLGANGHNPGRVTDRDRVGYRGSGRGVPSRAEVEARWWACRARR